MLQTEVRPSQVSEPEKVPSTSTKADTSHQHHQSQQYTTDEETRLATETLELLRDTDDPNKTPLKEATYFEGSGLLDHICHSKMKKTGLQSHQTVQQSTANIPTSSMVSVPIKTVPLAKVIIDDLVNLQSRLGSPNPLMTVIEGAGGKSLGTVKLKQKKQPQPLDVASVLAEIRSELSRRKTRTPMTSSAEPTGE